MQGPQIVLLEEMFNETVVINDKTYTNTQVSTELVKKLKNLELVQEYSEQQSMFGTNNTGASY